MLNRNANVSAGVLERLSSGKKINRAADDAAGMAISEKMKAQVRGLAKAAQNTLDGISLIQTAEGAMNEVHSMLQRMRELAVQSANGTTTNDDRKAIQDEINQLTSEINRIANGTEFNTRNVLRGNEGPNSNTTVHRMSTGEPAVIEGEISEDIDLRSEYLLITIDGKERSVRLNNIGEDASFDTRLLALNNAIGDLGQAIKTDGNKIEIRTTTIGGNSSIFVDGSSEALEAYGLKDLAANPQENPKYGGAEIDAGYARASIYFGSLPENGSSLLIGNEKIEFYDSSKGPYTGSNRPVDIYDNENSKYRKVGDIIDQINNMDFEGIKPATTMGDPVETRVDNAITGDDKGRLILEAVDVGFKGQAIFVEGTPKDFVTNLQVGPNQGQGFRLSVGDIRAFKLAISSSTPDGNTGVRGASYSNSMDITDGLSANKVEYAVDVSTEERATAAITVYNNAIVEVAQMRGALGAIQNRLEYTAANLENTQENLTAALSRIEDADMALEMSEFTKYNILIQAGTAMLAQANQRPQTVLQLLGG